MSAPPSADPGRARWPRCPWRPSPTVGVLEGDVQAAWAGGTACVPAVSGTRTLSQSSTTLAAPPWRACPAIGALADVAASRTQTGTYLVDDGVGGSDVVSRATTTVGDIDLLGGRVSVDVTSPVVLEARSDGTTGTAGFVSPPTVVATVAGSPVPIPLNGQPADHRGAGPAPRRPDDHRVPADRPVLRRDRARARSTRSFRIDLEVLSLPAPLGVKVADVSLAVAPMAVEATAPSGGVDCGGGPSSGPTALPTSPRPPRAPRSPTAPPPSPAPARPAPRSRSRGRHGPVHHRRRATTAPGPARPGTPLAAGPHTVTATQTAEGQHRATDSTTFTVVPDPDDLDGDGLPNSEESAPTPTRHRR